VLVVPVGVPLLLAGTNYATYDDPPECDICFLDYWLPLAAAIATSAAVAVGASAGAIFRALRRRHNRSSRNAEVPRQ